MAEQERKGTKRTTRDDNETRTPAPNSAVAEKVEKLKRTIDYLLDEIDGVLEENAEELVKSYVQRGGE
jgi:prokaryotic ubiquitin-like protein Pup